MRAGMMLTFVLAVLLLWYTYVVPPGPIGSRRPVRDDGGGGEVRGLGAGLKSEGQAVEDLDWPEYIYP